MKFFQNKKILVTGGKGFIGSHLVEALVKRGVKRKKIIIPDRQKDDLCFLKNCLRLTEGVDLIFHLAADVGGVAYSKTHPATQLYNCLAMDLNLVEAAKRNKVKKVVLVSCSPAYPQGSPMPLKEKDLFLGPPEDSHYGFGWAKRTMVVIAKAYHQEFGLDVNVVMANNTYGPGDNFDLETSHVIPALIRKSLEQKKLVIWGDGSPKRDFLYVKDLVNGIILAARKLKTPAPVNLGTGKETRIKELVDLIVKLSDFKGRLVWDKRRPKGRPRVSVDISLAKKLLTFKPKYSLEEGLKETIEWYQKHGQK